MAETEEYKIADHIMLQNQLCPVIFDEKGKMFETVLTGLQRIADYWWDSALEIFSDFKLKEVVLYGDIAGYIYNKKSEVWLGCIAETNNLAQPYLERINEVFVATELPYKFIHRPVHCRFLTQPIEGIPTYSLTQNKWLITPQKREFNFTLQDFEISFQQYRENIHNLFNSLPKINNQFLTMDSCRKFKTFLEELEQKANYAWAKSDNHEYNLDYLHWRSFKEMKGIDYFETCIYNSLNYNVNVLEEC